MAWVTGQLPAQPRKHRNSALYSGAEVTARTIFPKQVQASPFRSPALTRDFMTFSLQIRQQLRRPLRLGLGSFVALCTLHLTGCKEETAQKPEPTQPWLKEDAAAGERERSQAHRFVVAPGQSLELALPGRQGKPTGTLHGITGEFDVTLGELARTSGTLRIDLTELVMNAPEAKKRDRKTEEKGQPSEDLSAEQVTRLGLNWLGLGSEVSAEDRTKNRSAVFEVQSLRALSHPAASSGALRKGTGEELVRKVQATAEGELSLRGLSVQRQLRVALHFRYEGKGGKDQLPQAIEVELRPSARVPLNEYEIAPRSAAGNLLSEELAVLGKTVGSAADIRGSIVLHLSPPAPAKKPLSGP